MHCLLFVVFLKGNKPSDLEAMEFSVLFSKGIKAPFRMGFSISEREERGKRRREACVWGMRKLLHIIASNTIIYLCLYFL